MVLKHQPSRPTLRGQLGSETVRRPGARAAVNRDIVAAGPKRHDGEWRAYYPGLRKCPAVFTT